MYQARLFLPKNLWLPVYHYLRPYNSHKMDFRSSPCTILGYSLQHKGDKCLSPIGRILLFQNVTFAETKFPFHITSSSSSSQLSSTSNSPKSVSLPIIIPTSFNKPSATPHSIPTNTDLSLPIVDNLPSSNNTPFNSDSQHSSPIPIHSSPPTNCQNTHPMITRAKNGINKPKIFLSALTDQEPRHINEALAHEKWRTTVLEEYDALVKNKTCSLVCLPSNNMLWATNGFLN